MSNEWTPEEVMKPGEKWINAVLDAMSPEEVLQRYGPEDRLKGLRPEGVLKYYAPEQLLKELPPAERLSGLRPEEIEAYLQKLKRQEKFGNGGRTVEG